MMRRFSSRWPYAVALNVAAFFLFPPNPAQASIAVAGAAPLPSVKGNLPACAEPLRPAVRLRTAAGERLVYSLEMLGMHVGDVHFETAKRGRFQGKAATVYRSWLKPDGLVDAFLSIRGKTTSVVADDSFLPLQSVTQYHFRSERLEERQKRSGVGRRIVSTSTVNGKRRVRDDAYATETHDFISSFLLLRRLPGRANGCAVIYTHDRLYTAWVQADGQELIDTPQGPVQMERYRIRYGTSTSRKVRSIKMWLWPGRDRIPYQIKGESRFSPVARLAKYRPGESAL